MTCQMNIATAVALTPELAASLLEANNKWQEANNKWRQRWPTIDPELVVRFMKERSSVKP